MLAESTASAEYPECFHGKGKSSGTSALAGHQRCYPSAVDDYLHKEDFSYIVYQGIPVGVRNIFPWNRKQGFPSRLHRSPRNSSEDIRAYGR